MSCNNCLTTYGEVVQHDSAGCPLALSILCRRCHHRGHFTSQCDEQWPQWERPTSLEELIPADVRNRYNIHTHTAIDFPLPRGPDSVHELEPINTIEIPDPFASAADNMELKEFMAKNKIKAEKITKESRVACLEAVYAWGIAHGKRIVKKNEIVSC